MNILCRLKLHKWNSILTTKPMRQRQCRDHRECTVCGKRQVLKPWGWVTTKPSYFQKKQLNEYNRMMGI